jgi:hypothetical protein
MLVHYSSKESLATSHAFLVILLPTLFYENSYLASVHCYKLFIKIKQIKTYRNPYKKITIFVVMYPTEIWTY